MPNRACNLLPKDMLRAALADEVKECGPEVTLVGLGESFACGAEWLARAASCPHGTVCGPSCKLEGKAPSTDSCEEVALGVFLEVGWAHINNASLVHNSIWE